MDDTAYTQISLPCTLVDRLREQGQARGLSVEDQVRQVLESYLAHAEQVTDVAHPLLALANLGECPETDVSERTEEILAAEINQATGWSAPHANPC